MTRPTLYALVIAALLPALGCGYVKTPVVAFSDDGQYLPQHVGEGLVAAPESKIPDVPMPIGFKADRNKSHWNWNGRVRTVYHVYQGHAKQGDAVEFYQRTLPEYGWALVDIQSVAEATVIRYNKGPEQLVITTTRSWGVTTITIEIKAR